MKKFIIILITFILIMFNDVFAAEPVIDSNYVILIDSETGRILYQKNAYEPRYPASTTKILTAILTLENCDLNEMVTASAVAVNSVYAGGQTASIQPGETLSVRDLLSTMLIHSTNDSAFILAEHVGGSISSFVSMMNTRAKELGAKNTTFANPNGLPNTTHKCSVYDMALFARYAMQNFPVFRELVSTVHYTLPITEEYTALYKNEYPDATNVIRYLTTTTNHLINPAKTDFYYENAIGIKTGYTDYARNCLVAGAEKDGVELICVIFNANGWTNMRNDTVSLFEYGFSMLKNEEIITAGTCVQQIEIKNSDKKLDVIVQDTIKATVHKAEDISAYTPTIKIDSNLTAPIDQNTVIGTITYNINDLSYSSNLLAGNSIEKKPLISAGVTTTLQNISLLILKAILWIFIAFVLLFIMLIFLRAYIITKKQRKRSRRRVMYNSRFR